MSNEEYVYIAGGSWGDGKSLACPEARLMTSVKEVDTLLGFRVMRKGYRELPSEHDLGHLHGGSFFTDAEDADTHYRNACCLRGSNRFMGFRVARKKAPEPPLSETHRDVIGGACNLNSNFAGIRTHPKVQRNLHPKVPMGNLGFRVVCKEPPELSLSDGGRWVRGGSWLHRQRGVRCAVRRGGYPEDYDEGLGFRVVRKWHRAIPDKGTPGLILGGSYFYEVPATKGKPALNPPVQHKYHSIGLRVVREFPEE